jgi:hypothetical protein
VFTKDLGRPLDIGLADREGKVAGRKLAVALLQHDHPRATGS